MTHLYKHICGYPIEEGSELSRCPGCGGRITPWTIKPGVPKPSGSEGDCLLKLATWLKDNEPDLARRLAEAVNQIMDDTGETEADTCFMVLASELQKER